TEQYNFDCRGGTTRAARGLADDDDRARDRADRADALVGPGQKLDPGARRRARGGRLGPDKLAIRDRVAGDRRQRVEERRLEIDLAVERVDLVEAQATDRRVLIVGDPDR